MRTAYSIAAVLAVALIGLSFYTANSKHQDTTPKATTREISISLDNRAELEVVVLPPGEDKEIPFRLVAPDNKSYPKYVLKVFDSLDREVLVWDGLEADGSEEFSFSQDSSVFTPGINTLRIFAIDNDTPILLGEYQFKLIRQAQ